MINCKLLTVQAVKHTQAGVVQDVHLNTIIEILKVFVLFGKVILCYALKHCRCGLLSKEAPVEQDHPETPAVPHRIIM